MRRDEARTWTFLAGLAVGIAGGTIAAILYAPASGREVRARVTGRARHGRARLSAAVERGRGALRAGLESIDRGRDRLSVAVEEGRDAYRRTNDAGV